MPASSTPAWRVRDCWSTVPINVTLFVPSNVNGWGLTLGYLLIDSDEMPVANVANVANAGKAMRMLSITWATCAMGSLVLRLGGSWLVC